MNENPISKIDELIEGARDAVIRSTKRLVNIKSVEDAPLPGAPFGEGARAVLDELIFMANEDGFYTKDYGVGVISIGMNGEDADLGIWTHADVVPEGEGWSFPPYSATEYKGCIIGRGATDNKGQIAAIYELFKIFKENGISLSYNPAIYVGSCEETGMKDMFGVEGNPDALGFLNVCKQPTLSLIPDADFPVGYAGKGALNVKLKSKNPLNGFEIVSGTKEAPFRATAVFHTAHLGSDFAWAECVRLEDGRYSVSATSSPRHGAHPDPSGNMITRLSDALLSGAPLDFIDRKILEFFKLLSLDVHGSVFGLDMGDGRLSATTVFFQKITTEDGVPELMLNIRYPSVFSFEQIIERVGAVAEEHGFFVSEAQNKYPPYLYDPECEIISLLHTAASSVTGSDKAPYTMGGGTYANCLKNAIPFGMSGNLPPDDFENGRGGAHGVDEAVSVDRLIIAMKIYARALLMLNGRDISSLAPRQLKNV